MEKKKEAPAPPAPVPHRPKPVRLEPPADPEAPFDGPEFGPGAEPEIDPNELRPPEHPAFPSWA